MTTQTHNLTYQDLLGKLERSHESYRELEQAHNTLLNRCKELEEENASQDVLIDSMRTDHAETEDRYQNEIKRLNKIIDSIQGYVGALEVGVK